MVVVLQSDVHWITQCLADLSRSAAAQPRGARLSLETEIQPRDAQNIMTVACERSSADEGVHVLQPESF